ncbi:MAG: hypothetical protein WAP56_07230 [Acetivibrionales bacterium]|nr:hypothetical protein [Bacillota bacterium]NLP07908.1 hypothetical protein [Clostridiaceae bacterium]HOA55914.1 hypothetical protein [Clostridiales bacterium]HPZ05869.1 hypothetical protein [Clostridiales bacterium]HQD30448.1 hypothetical protein [Clostridiales bacterium]
MLIVLSRYKILFAILLIIILAAVIWLMISAKSSKIPSKGVFVMNMRVYPPPVRCISDAKNMASGVSFAIKGVDRRCSIL